MTQTHFISKDHGYPGFSASREPVLRITPGEGDRITFETDDAAYEQMHEHHDMEALTAPLNPVTGPVYVEGAEPGDVLAVHVHDITFKGVGWSKIGRASCRERVELLVRQSTGHRQG